jgi:glyoxylase-like metal-dependent hydrolase (beta-lactamase superfamily II)
MTMSRRIALCVGLVIVYGTGVFIDAQRGGGPAGAQATAPPPNLIKVRDDVYVIQNANHTVAEIGQNGGNVVVYVTNDGVILIDSKNERMHDDIVAKVKSVTDKPIKYMILTHNHGDHSGGSARLQSIGVTVLSSVGARENMIRANQPGAAAIAFGGYAQVALGGKELQLREYRGHTRGDTVISLPAARVIAAGDLVTTPESIPTIVNYGDGGNWSDLGRSLEDIARLEFDTVIGGHGPNLTRQEFLKYRDRVIAIRERVRALNRERKSAEEIAATVGKEFNWGTGPAAGNIAGMMLELR